MMIATESITVKKKLKIKFGGKHIDADSQICKFEQPTSLPDWSCGSANEPGQHERVGKISAVNGSKLRISLPVSNKRKPPELLDCPQKRLKMDRGITQQCSSMLKKLMHHHCGWPFIQPVDPVALNIPDYFSIIAEPMDLGTVKSKLAKNLYLGIEEFAADVRLTFSNAMLYNPPGNTVHSMADQLSKIFESGLKVLEAKWNRTPKAETPKAELGSSDKQFKVGNSVGLGEIGMTQPVGSKNRMPNGEAKYKNDAGFLKARVLKVSQSKPSSNTKKGTDSDSSLASRSKCDVCGTTSCQCSQITDPARIVSSDLPSERTPVTDQDRASPAHGSTLAKNTLGSRSGKTSGDCNGIPSAMDDDGPCTTSGAVGDPTDATCVDGWAVPLPDVQLSPKKALRAAILKSRFAATILKAQHKTLLDHGDMCDPMKLQQEKERLERRQLEEKASIEAQIKAAEARAEAESRKQRERDREAARIALQKMEKTVEIGENLQMLKELEILSGVSLSVHVPESDDGSEVLSGGFDGSPGKIALEQLGLFMKDDYIADDDEEEEEETVCNEGEDGEII